MGTLTYFYNFSVNLKLFPKQYFKKNFLSIGGKSTKFPYLYNLVSYNNSFYE